MPGESVSILFVGNSHTFVNDMPLTVRRPDGVCASFFEAYVRHYPRAKGEAVGGGTTFGIVRDEQTVAHAACDVGRDAFPFVAHDDESTGLQRLPIDVLAIEECSVDRRSSGQGVDELGEVNI